MEVINGGYGIKNPLLSPDIHIQPVTVDENITGNNKNASRKKIDSYVSTIYF